MMMNNRYSPGKTVPITEDNLNDALHDLACHGSDQTRVVIVEPDRRRFYVKPVNNEDNPAYGTNYLVMIYGMEPHFICGGHTFRGLQLRVE